MQYFWLQPPSTNIKKWPLSRNEVGENLPNDLEIIGGSYIGLQFNISKGTFMCEYVQIMYILHICNIYIQNLIYSCTMEISASENCINKNDETQNMFCYCLKVCTKVPANLNMIAYKDFYLLMHDFDIHTKHDLQFDLIRHLIWHWASLTYVIVCLYSIYTTSMYYICIAVTFQKNIR